jgi:DNA repair protein RadD
MRLRPYQNAAVQSVFDWFGTNDGNPLIVMPTGTGKALTIADFIKRALHAYPQTRVLMLTHVRELIRQNAETMIRIWPDAPLGICSSGLGRKDFSSQIIFAGIQSIHRYADRLPPVDLVIVDECHLIPTKDNTMYGRFLADLRRVNPYVKIVGFTATHYRLDSGYLHTGEDALFGGVSYEYGIRDAINDGWLCEPIPRHMETTLDTKGVARQGGDFKPGDLERAVDVDPVTRAVCAEIVAHGVNRKSWLVFAAGVKHAHHICEMLQAHGITAAVVDGGTATGERDATVNAFKRGEIRALVGAKIFCLDEETEILTETGFVGINEMSYDHKIAAWKEDRTIEFTKPEFIVKRPRFEFEKMVSIGSNNGPKIRVTSNHRMVITCGKDQSKIKVVSAEELSKKSYFNIPTCGYSEPNILFVETPKPKSNRAALIRSNSYSYRKNGMSKDDALSASIEFFNRRAAMKYKSPHELSLDECKFIGVWLGDGTSYGGRVSISQSDCYQDNISEIDRLVSSIGLSHSIGIHDTASGNKSKRWNFPRGTGGMGQHVEKGFFEYEPYLKKDGTDLFLHLNRGQLLSLIDGLFLADGNHHCQSGNSKVITGTQIELYNILQAACSMRGVCAIINKKKTKQKEHHKQQYSISFSERKNWWYTSKNNLSIDGEYKKEKVWCVTSTTSYLICRRRGKVFVTGNTTGFDAPNIDMIADVHPTESTSLHVQKIGRGTRIHPSTYYNGFNDDTAENRRAAIANSVKPSCLYLDFAGNAGRHGPLDQLIIKEPGKGGGGEAPVKECPECFAQIHASIRTCPYCGHEFPPPEPKINARAGTDAILSTQIRPEWVKVSDVSYFAHRKPDSPVSMRVEYRCGMSLYREWICFEHTGYARQKACQWWASRAGTNVPNSVAEALKRLDEIRKPSRIQVRKNGKFFEVVAADYAALEVVDG